MSLKNFLEITSKMPEFPHSVEGEQYDVNNSRVVKWMISQPAVKEYLMEKARAYGAIEFDAQKKCWRGSGKSDGFTYSEEQIVKILGEGWMKSMDLLTECTLKYGIECGKWNWNYILKRMVRKGLLVQDKKRGFAVAR